VYALTDKQQAPQPGSDPMRGPALPGADADRLSHHRVGVGAWLRAAGGADETDVTHVPGPPVSRRADSVIVVD
jgi:hypothetical protein